MRAVVCRQHGSIDQLEVGDDDAPAIRPGTIRLRVLAAGVNDVDHLIVGGRYQVSTPTPFVPGFDFVGRIAEVADDVARDAPDLAVGARVVVLAGGGGGFAEEAVVPAHTATLLPDVITDGQGATFVRSYLTAAFALRRRVDAGRGDSILVVGVESGVGLAAIDVAGAMGMRVFVAVSSDEQRRLALDRGAEVAVDATSDDIAADIRSLMDDEGKVGVDYVYDPVGGERAETWLGCLGEGGEYLAVGVVAGVPSLPLDQVVLRNRRVTGVDWAGWSGRRPSENAALLDELMRQIAAGRLRPVEPTAYPLDRTVDALRDLAERRASGKLVIIP